MYSRWAEKHGCEGRIVEKCSCSSNGIRLATIEFESEYFFGYLSGEKGMHRMICTSIDGSNIREVIVSLELLQLKYKKPLKRSTHTHK